MVGVRRSLSQVGGRIERSGEPALAATLEAAWRTAERDDRSLTHSFHAYPARVHAALVRVVIEEFSQPGELVADPFCGSGTTLVEAFAAGRRAFGADVNGVAALLARQKSRRTSDVWRARLVDAAGRIAGRAASAAARGDGGGGAPVPAELRGVFEPQVWRELDALGRAINGERDAGRHLALMLVLSSLLTKLSRREAETSTRTRERHLARGFAARLFSDRAEELATGLAALAAAAGARAPSIAPPVIALADARRLPLRSASVALVVTSPPYAGTYDYARIQELRARLIGVRLDAAARHEIGARVGAARDPKAALAAFRSEFGEALAEIARVLTPRGRAVVIVGDSRVGRLALRSDELVAGLARAAGLAVAAAASQERPGPRPLGATADEPRREHLLLLVKRSVAGGNVG
jgi:SAM-dependent methyltransferase